MTQSSYYRARYYDPQTGRFLSEDPIGFGGGDNFYRNVRNHPTDLGDPMGLSPADIQRFKEACKKCTQGLTDQGFRQPGTGKWAGFRNDNQVALGILKGLLSYWGGDPLKWGNIQGCKSQATMAKGTCLEGDPSLSGWKFSEVPWWLGFHTIVLGESPDQSDPLVYCDPWRNETWTAPRNPPDIWPRYSKW